MFYFQGSYRVKNSNKAKSLLIVENTQLFVIKIVGMIKPANEFWITISRKEKTNKKENMHPFRQIVKFLATGSPLETRNLRIVTNAILNLILCSTDSPLDSLLNFFAM